MRRKIWIGFMILFTIFMSATLLTSFLCGAPTDSSEAGRYLFGAVGMSVFLPVGFTFFLIRTFDLTRELEESEAMREKEAEDEGCGVISDLTDCDVQISVLVNALAEKKNLTPEEKEKLLAYLEEL